METHWARPEALTARPTAFSPSGWTSPAIAVGLVKIGTRILCPKRCVVVSILETSRRIRGRRAIREYVAAFRVLVCRSVAADETNAHVLGEKELEATDSKSLTERMVAKSGLVYSGAKYEDSDCAIVRFGFC